MVLENGDAIPARAAQSFLIDRTYQHIQNLTTGMEVLRFSSQAVSTCRLSYLYNTGRNTVMVQTSPTSGFVIIAWPQNGPGPMLRIRGVLRALSLTAQMRGRLLLPPPH